MNKATHKIITGLNLLLLLVLCWLVVVFRLLLWCIGAVFWILGRLIFH